MALEQTDRNVYLEDIPMATAQARLREAMAQAGRGGQPLRREVVALADALGRVTSAPVWARMSSPHYHAAAMDGYAVAAERTRDATETRPVALSAQEAIPVNTGAPLPPATNAVIMIEHVQHLPGGGIEIIAPVVPYQHVRMMGEDMVATELVLPANHRIRPVDLGAIAGCGHHEVEVWARPLVAIIPTGSELVSAGHTPKPGEVIEYNSLVLAGLVGEAGGAAHTLPIVPDDRDALRAAIEQALSLSPDLILLLSGSSAGAKDFTAAVVRSMGDLLVHGVAVRPGHPVIMGMIAGVPVIGVPGYPVSAALTGEIFIQPILAGWLGQIPPLESRPQLTAHTTRKLNSPMGDDDFQRVTLAQVGDRLLLTPIARGAGVITSLVRADGLAHIPRFSEGADVGAPVRVIAYRQPDEIARAVLAMGSHDPMLDLLAQFVAVRHAGYRLSSVNVGSMGGLVALRRGEAHLAGLHLLDEATGEYNLPFVQSHLRDVPLKVITFAHRQQGLIVPPGNPQGIAGLDDLPRLTLVNRQRGAGTRLLLDYELKRRGIAPEQVRGYDREEYTHLGVAVAVATGIADCGMGVLSAALALGLDFVPVGWERYDFVIPAAHAQHPGVARVLDTLHSDEFRAALSAQPGYDTSETGREQYRYPAG